MSSIALSHLAAGILMNPPSGGERIIKGTLAEARLLALTIAGIGEIGARPLPPVTALELPTQ